MADYSKDVLVSTDWVAEHLDDDSVRVVEVDENPALYAESHIPELYASKGVLDGEPIIAYCRIGERSAHTWFVLHELLGKDDVQNYDGSWTEWGNLIDVPIEKDV